MPPWKASTRRGGESHHHARKSIRSVLPAHKHAQRHEHDVQAGQEAALAAVVVLRPACCSALAVNKTAPAPHIHNACARVTLDLAAKGSRIKAATRKRAALKTYTLPRSPAARWAAKAEPHRTATSSRTRSAFSRIRYSHRLASPGSRCPAVDRSGGLRELPIRITPLHRRAGCPLATANSECWDRLPRAGRPRLLPRYSGEPLAQRTVKPCSPTFVPSSNSSTRYEPAGQSPPSVVLN